MKLNTAVLALLVLANLIGFFVGMYNYSPQLSRTDCLFWLFVIDCPLYVVLFAFLVVLKRIGEKADLLSFVVSVGLILYGAWTLFAMLWWGEYYFVPQMLAWNLIDFVVHILMIAEGFVLLSNKVKWEYVAVALAWFLFNDWIDYFGPNVHPWLPSANAAPAFVFAVAATFVSVAIVYLMRKRNLGIALER